MKCREAHRGTRLVKEAPVEHEMGVTKGGGRVKHCQP